MPYSYLTINSMLENAVQCDLEFIPEDIAQFIGETKFPGKKVMHYEPGTAFGELACALRFSMPRATPTSPRLNPRQTLARRAHTPPTQEARRPRLRRLMYNQPRAASLLALEDAVLWSVERTTFRSLILSAASKMGMDKSY